LGEQYAGKETRYSNNYHDRFLGIGKTTAIRYLLETKPPAEKMAVLVKEFGEVGLDASLFAKAGRLYELCLWLAHASRAKSDHFA
jgi:hypothetical protein